MIELEGVTIILKHVPKVKQSFRVYAGQFRTMHCQFWEAVGFENWRRCLVVDAIVAC